MDILGALKYPYQKENWKNTILIPGLYLIGVMVIAFVVMMVIILPMAMSGNVSNKPPFLPIILMEIIIFIVMMPLYGYYWEIIDVWQTQGYLAPAPSWAGKIKDYYMAGLHMVLAYLVFIIPSILVFISLGLLAPFIYGPFMLAAKEKTVGAVIGAIGPSIKYTSSNYLSSLGAFYGIFLLTLIAMVPYFILSFTLIGGFIFIMAFYFSLLNIWVQGYGYRTDGIVQHDF